MQNTSRLEFLKTGLAGTVLAGAAVNAETLPVTPTQTKGPFYPVTPQKDKDFDLTQVDGNDGVAKGQVIWVEGIVQDTEGQVVPDASVEIWQANAAGRYAHPHDTSSAPLDPNFQGWAVVLSGTAGQFKFKTIMPGAYAAGKDWTRPPHIHFKIAKLGYVELATQLYFPEQPLNDKDHILNRHPVEQRKLLISSLISKEPETYRLVFTIQKA